MTLPAAPNPISFSQISTELGLPSNQTLGLSNIYAKALIGDWVNPISMSSGRGKVWIPTYSTIYSTYGERSIIVPAGTVAVGIKAWGGGGASGGRGSAGGVSGCGGAGGFMWGIYDAVAGETLYTNVGGGGQGGAAGGAIAPYAAEGGGGGGATWVRNYSRAGQPFICIVAGGGGGGGTGSQTNDSGGPGGGGGGDTGANGVAGWNAGGTGSSAGGSAASGGSAGAGGAGLNDAGDAGGFISGGTGGTNGTATAAGGIGGGGYGGNNGNEGGGGGGGGSGWYGGGGGGWSNNQGGGGGGGGSNYFAGISLLYNVAGQTGSVGQIAYTYPNFGGPEWSNFGVGGYGRNTTGADGINGFDGALALHFFTT